MDVMYEELVNGIVKIIDTKLISIILYGSVARGSASFKSDIDILLDEKISRETEDEISSLVDDLN